MTDIYIFATPTTHNKLVAYPHDQTHEYFQHAINMAKNNAQIVILRRDNLLHYCYIRKLNNKWHFGLCLRIDRIYTDVQQLFEKFDTVFTRLVEEGIFLTIGKKANIQLLSADFTIEAAVIRQMSEDLKSSLNISDETTLLLPSADFAISINECIELSLEDSTTGKEIINSIKKYCNVYLVKTHAEIARITGIARIIEQKDKEITTLQNDISQRDDEISKLKKQKSKYIWVLLLSLILFASMGVFVIYVQQKTLIIKEKTTQIDTLTEQINILTKQINALKAQLNDLSKSLNEIPVNYSLPAWTSTNQQNNSKSSYTYMLYADKGDVLVIPYFVSSETRFDFLDITLKQDRTNTDEQLVYESGLKSDTCYYTFKDSDCYQLTVSYIKDNSFSKNNDNAGVQGIFINRESIRLLQKKAVYKN